MLDDGENITPLRKHWQQAWFILLQLLRLLSFAPCSLYREKRWRCRMMQDKCDRTRFTATTTTTQHQQVWLTLLLPQRLRFTGTWIFFIRLGLWLVVGVWFEMPDDGGRPIRTTAIRLDSLKDADARHHLVPAEQQQLIVVEKHTYLQCTCGPPVQSTCSSSNFRHGERQSLPACRVPATRCHVLFGHSRYRER